MTKYLYNFSNNGFDYAVLKSKIDRENRKKDKLFGKLLREKELNLQQFQQQTLDFERAQKERTTILSQNVEAEKDKLRKIIADAKVRVEEREKLVKNITPYYLEGVDNIYFGHSVKGVNIVLKGLESQTTLGEHDKTPDTQTFLTKKEGPVQFYRNPNYKETTIIAKNVLFGYPK